MINYDTANLLADMEKQLLANQTLLNDAMNLSGVIPAEKTKELLNILVQSNNNCVKSLQSIISTIPFLNRDNVHESTYLGYDIFSVTVDGVKKYYIKEVSQFLCNKISECKSIISFLMPDRVGFSDSLLQQITS